MEFLDEYDSVPKDRPDEQVKTIFRWLRLNWRGMYADLRKNRPVFPGPTFTMITRWSDVNLALTNPTTFTVKPYQPKMDPSVGPFMLSRDDTELNWHEKSVMRSVLRWQDLPMIRALVAQTASKSLGSSGATVELVEGLGRLIPLRIVQEYFGFPGPDDATMLRWSRATQHDMFRNAANDPAVHAANIQAGAEMQSYLWKFLAAKWANEIVSDDPVSRLCRLVSDGNSGFQSERAVSNVCGLLVGAIETMSQAIIQAVEQILMRPELALKAKSLAVADDPLFAAIVWEALRFNPITTLVPRLCEKDVVLAQNTASETVVRAGTPVVVCIGSAMFDEAAFPNPDELRLDRSFSSYLHLGFGHHECLGKYVGVVAIPEAVRQFFLLPSPSLLSGDAGKIDFKGGPFPERFEVATGR